MNRVRPFRFASLAGIFVLLTIVVVSAKQGMGDGPNTTKPFSGVKVDGGTATHSKQGGKNILTLSDDFQIPDTPAPHWHVGGPML